MRNQVLKEILPTILFYAGFVLAVYLLELVIPSGPCVPGGIALFFVLPFVSAILLAKGIHQKKISRVLIHTLVVLAFLILLLSE